MRRHSAGAGLEAGPLPRRHLLYVTAFTSAFLAATVLPLVADAALAGALAGGAAWPGLVAAATFGSTLGAVLFWWFGRFIERFRGRRWFPASPRQLDRAQNWFQRYGVWSLLLTWIPGLGDGLTVGAGVMRVGIVPFCLLVAIGRGLRYAAIVLALDGVVLPSFVD